MQSTIELAVLVFVILLGIVARVLHRMGFRKLLLLLIPLGLAVVMGGIVALVVIKPPAFMGGKYPGTVTKSGPSTPPQPVTSPSP